MHVSPDQTVFSLKSQLKELINLEQSNLRLFFGGKAMKDKDKLKIYKIYKNVVIQVAVNEIKLNTKLN